MSFSCLMRTGSEGGRLLREWDSWRREPQIPENWLAFFGGCYASREGRRAGWEIRTIVFCVVVGVLDRVSPTDGGGVVVGVAFVGDEVDFFEQFCFVVLETADWAD